MRSVCLPLSIAKWSVDMTAWRSGRGLMHDALGISSPFELQFLPRQMVTHGHILRTYYDHSNARHACSIADIAYPHSTSNSGTLRGEGRRNRGRVPCGTSNSIPFLTKDTDAALMRTHQSCTIPCMLRNSHGDASLPRVRSLCDRGHHDVC